MPIELRILTGARAGQSETFDKPVIAIGRHPDSDLRFDVKADLDVSTRHAEIRAHGSRYTVLDQESRNGTFVNGERVSSGGGRALYEGDVIAFGPKGPTAEVRGIERRPSDLDRTHDNPRAPSGPTRRPTTERIAVAVQEQTRGLKMMMSALVVVLVALAAGVWWMGVRATARQKAEIQRLIQTNEQESRDFQARLQATDDTALKNGLQRKMDSLSKSATEGAPGAGGATVRLSLEQTQRQLRAFADADWSAVHTANDPAVVLISVEIAGKPSEATGFSITEAGLIVTNRHVVFDKETRASSIQVKFANTRQWLRAHIVRASDDPAVDLALVQVDASGHYPSVTTVSERGVDTPVGAGIVTLGFPLGTDLPMEGSGAALIAKTTLAVGHISKTTSDLLQIDSFAGHGSSGSPVLDAHGHVIGVIFGGPPGAQGRIAYAVPSERIIELRKAAGV